MEHMLKSIISGYLLGNQPTTVNWQKANVFPRKVIARIYAGTKIGVAKYGSIGAFSK